MWKLNLIKLRNSENTISRNCSRKSIPGLLLLHLYDSRADSPTVLMPYLVAPFFIGMAGFPWLVFEISTFIIGLVSETSISWNRTTSGKHNQHVKMIIVTHIQTFTPPSEIHTNVVPYDALSQPWPSWLMVSPSTWERRSITSIVRECCFRPLSSLLRFYQSRILEINHNQILKLKSGFQTWYQIWQSSKSQTYACTSLCAPYQPLWPHLIEGGKCPNGCPVSVPWCECRFPLY